MLFCLRPYRVECTGSLSTSEVKQHRARLVLGWGTAWEDLRVLSAFYVARLPGPYSPISEPRFHSRGVASEILAAGALQPRPFSQAPTFLFLVSVLYSQDPWSPDSTAWVLQPRPYSASRPDKAMQPMPCNLAQTNAAASVFLLVLIAAARACACAKAMVSHARLTWEALTDNDWQPKPKSHGIAAEAMQPCHYSQGQAAKVL